ncbi:pantetheine-phosphate adenylyltransferase, partial [Candidatus Sumerlaeota bacterium]|nr:pantetheine-phosphate adenylyltransferase [Candidatus Sumerlaeota bacterium]
MAGRALKALYPGTFDALTYGHLDIITRGSQIFDKVTVAVANNDTKTPMFSVEERLKALRAEAGHLVNVEIDSFHGLTVDYARQIGAKVIIRGLRVASDFEYELQMALMNRVMDSSVETLFLAPSAQTLFVSSSLVKEILVQGGDISKFVPPATEKMLR